MFRLLKLVHIGEWIKGWFFSVIGNAQVNALTSRYQHVGHVHFTQLMVGSDLAERCRDWRRRHRQRLHRHCRASGCQQRRQLRVAAQASSGQGCGTYMPCLLRCKERTSQNVCTERILYLSLTRLVLAHSFLKLFVCMQDNPWPTWPTIYRVDYGHAESANKYGKVRCLTQHSTTLCIYIHTHTNSVQNAK